jgi:predicted HD phosphohydrolase
VGQFIDSPAEAALQKLHHETRALPWLSAAGFRAEVLEPIRMHTEAGRYLASVDEWRALERNLPLPDSLRLRREGGRMSVEECRAFARQPFADSALQLARWDDMARMADKRTPPLDYYLRMLEDLLRTRQTGRLSVA